MRYRPVDVGGRLGRLEVLERLGEGGMATVFRARDAALRREVAVKVLFPHLARRPEIVKRFHREARAAAGLDHPNILRVLDVGGGPEARGDDGLCDPPFIVLELIEGESLRELVDRSDRGPLVAEAAAAIGAVIARALGVAHAAGIVHRDIKPANVMIAPGGRLVIADFGVAHLESEDSLVTRTGALLGTPAFMSPEQASAEPLDARSDLYSLGATLYRLATGSMPYTGSTARVVSAIVAGEPVEPLRRAPTMGPDLARIIEKLMARQPGDRYGDAAAAEAALIAACGRDDPEALLAELFADLEATSASLEAEAVERSLAQAERAAGAGKVPRAIALADRVLAHEPDNARALAIVDRLSRGRRGRWPWLAAACAVAALGGGAVAWQGGWLARQRVVAAPPAAPPDAAVEPAAAPAVDAGALAPPPAIDAAPRAVAADARRRHRDPSPRRREPRDAAALPPPIDAAVAATHPAPTDARVPSTGDVVVQLIGGACNVSIDGQRRSTLRGKHTFRGLATGPHQVSCQVAGGRLFSDRVVVVAGKAARVVFRNQVTVTNRSGMQVRYGGHTYGNGQSLKVTPSSRVRFQFLQSDRRWKPTYIKVRGRCTLSATSCH